MAEDTREDDLAAIALGVESLLGPAIRECCGQVEAAVQSQEKLAGSIDRLTEELDRMLDETPSVLPPRPTLSGLPSPAERIAILRRRISVLSTSLGGVQERLASIARLVSSPGSTVAPTGSSQLTFEPLLFSLAHPSTSYTPSTSSSSARDLSSFSGSKETNMKDSKRLDQSAPGDGRDVDLRGSKEVALADILKRLDKVTS
eukprot:TRINITY_DN9838_c0_g2_i1.p1 TRINITY_DN9838_c0_g2~~TRINITY_DN9838_c0_g2_i1.p1  ORF type:complete len:202 (+),score=31.54 TRINITY_DN9838_c0_g2_i1:478-1083(+)